MTNFLIQNVMQTFLTSIKAVIETNLLYGSAVWHIIELENSMTKYHMLYTCDVFYSDTEQ